MHSQFKWHLYFQERKTFSRKNSRLRLVIIILVFRKGFLSLILHHQSTLFSWFTFSHVVFVFVYVYLYICMSSSPSSCVLNICTFTMHIIWPLSYSFKLKHDMALYSVFKVIEIPKYLFLIFLSTINSFLWFLWKFYLPRVKTKEIWYWFKTVIKYWYAKYY